MCPGTKRVSLHKPGADPAAGADLGVVTPFAVMTDRLVRSPKVLWRRTLRGVVLRPVGRSAFMLDGSGWLVWEVLARPATLEELSEQLAARTGGEAKTIAADVQPVLHQLAGLEAVVAS
jgi:hypothetical protein